MKVFTVREIIDAYEFDIEMLRADKKNSNRSKLIQRDELMLQFYLSNIFKRAIY